MQPLKYDPYSALNQKLLDGCLAGLAGYVAYQIRFDGHVPLDARFQLACLLPLIVLGRVLLNQFLGTYRLIWKYVGLADAAKLATNHAALSAGLLVLRYATPAGWAMVQVPLSVIALEYLLSLAGSLSARALRRMMHEGLASHALNGAAAVPVLLIGAGRAGTRVAKEIRSRIDMSPAGFLDDDPKKQNSMVCGLRVLGRVSELAATIQRHEIREVIVCLVKPPRKTLRTIWAVCEHLDVPVKLVPSLDDILHGRVSIASFREVEMKDLLGRDPVVLSAEDKELLEVYGGRTILVTGAGGSIGSELAYQLHLLKPKRLVLLDKDENGLNDTDVRLRGHPTVEVVPVVADIRSRERLRSIFAAYSPDVVFHAAAHKHVHLMEVNPCEAIANNVVGTRHLVELSLAFRVGRFIQVSTDKAVNPTSVMGASKRVCEMIVQVRRNQNHTHFCCVRFGNVLGSRGSVVPIFQKQILQGGPVTVTHPDAQRFLMTIPEAVCLLIQAGTMAHTREIFVLDMGEPVLIKDLARDLIELSGLCPGRDVRLEITQMHPGEKLAEELVDEQTESLDPTRFAKIRKISSETLDPEEFLVKLEALEQAAASGHSEQVYDALADLKMGYSRKIEALPTLHELRPEFSSRVASAD